MSEERAPEVKIRITGLQEAQLAALVTIEAACAALYHEIGFDAAEVPVPSAAELSQLPRKHNVFVAEVDGEVAGYLAWRDESPGVAFVAALSVHPDRHRGGVGTRLVDALRDDAIRLGIDCSTVRCWSKASWAMRFYEQAGFRALDDGAAEKVRAWRDEHEAGRPVTRRGEVVLWKPLAPES